MWKAPSALVGASRTQRVALSRTVTATPETRPPLESPTEPSNAPLTSDVCAREPEASKTQTRSVLWRSLTFPVYSVQCRESERFRVPEARCQPDPTEDRGGSPFGRCTGDDGSTSGHGSAISVSMALLD